MKKENIFTKLKNFFLKLFRKEKIKEIPSGNTIEETPKETKPRNTLQDLRVEENRLFTLQNKLKRNAISVKDLNNKELEELIQLYKTQIKEKVSS